MKKKSLWLDIKEDNITKLEDNIEVDVLIIGGGITGITTLYKLKDSNLKTCLVDQDLVGHGVTGKTTGKINYLQEVVYYNISKKYNTEMAHQYYLSQQTAIQEILDIINNEQIECNLNKVTSYVLTNDSKEISKIKFEKKLLTKFGADVREHHDDIDHVRSIYAISVDNTYVFHPIKYLLALKKICVKAEQPIYERTKILDLKKVKDGYIGYTNKYHIKAKKVILACHYPFFLFPYFTPLKVGIEKSYITASLSSYQDITLITSNKPTTSIRYHKDKDSYLIYLANSANICNRLNDNKNFKEVINEIARRNITPSYIWKNDDLITVDKMPYIGMIEKDNPDLLIGTGYNTWGMTNGTLAGLILSDMILGNNNEFINMFNPLRANKLSNISSFVTNISSSAKGYVQNKLSKNKTWYNDSITFKKVEGKNIAIYNDGDDHIIYNKCPHMGCSLVFNEVEKTWDCPCHASRFDIDGKCIKGPSKYNISYKGKD